MTEHGFIRFIHGKLDQNLIKWKINDRFMGGVPDAYYMGDQGVLWVEYKYVKLLPVRDTTIIKTCLTELQKIWLDDLERCKQPCALAIGCGDRVAVLRAGKWRDGITAKEFRETSMSRKDLAAWIGKQCLATNTSTLP